MNRLYKVIVIGVLLLFYYYIEIKRIVIPCLLKNTLHIACPMCGLTRSILALLEGDIVLSLRYNLLGFIVFLFIILNIILLLYDIIFGKKKVEYLYKKIGNYYVLIVIVLIINMIINNVRGI